MFYHAVHLLNHGSALESGTLGLHGAQFCSLAGATDAGVVCTCASRTLSCPEPAIVGTTKGLHVNLPELGNKFEAAGYDKLSDLVTLARTKADAAATLQSDIGIKEAHAVKLVRWLRAPPAGRAIDDLMGE